jgi:hypothetical protein
VRNARAVDRYAANNLAMSPNAKRSCEKCRSTGAAAWDCGLHPPKLSLGFEVPFLKTQCSLIIAIGYLPRLPSNKTLSDKPHLLFFSCGSFSLGVAGAVAYR